MSSDSPVSIVFGINGDPVQVITIDGITYRLSVDTTLSDGYNQLGTIQNPLIIDPAGERVTPIVGSVIAIGTQPNGYIYHGQPVVISGVDYTDGTVRLFNIDGYGSLKTSLQQASVSTTTAIASTMSNTILLPANHLRLGATIYNNSTSNLYFLFGSGASTSNFTNIITPNQYFEVPFNWCGDIEGFWASVNGNAMITEIVSS